MTESINRQPQGIPAGGQFAPTTHAEPDVALSVDPDDRVDFGWDGPDDEDPMSPEDRKLWDGFHRHAYNYGTDVLGVTGFEDRDTVERFAGFAANAYQKAGWDGMMDIHGVVDDWMAQERPLG